LAVILLLPVPALAAVNLGSWSVFSVSPTSTSGWSAQSSNTNLGSTNDTLVIGLPPSGTTYTNEVIVTFAAPITSLTPGPGGGNTFFGQTNFTGEAGNLVITSGTLSVSMLLANSSHSSVLTLGTNQFTGTDFSQSTNFPLPSAAFVEVILDFKPTGTPATSSFTYSTSPSVTFNTP
jgi:hypothetical protein